MNNKRLVSLSNIIGISSIILLIYWVFIFISITVFELKVFRENMTETFYLSVFGILALMFGALMINIMFNLTRIAEKHNQDDFHQVKKKSKTLNILIIVSFPVLFLFLYGGDYLTSKKKEEMLISSAQSIIESDNTKREKLINYSFDKKWITETANTLSFYSSIDTNFPHVSVIVADTLDNATVYLGFDTYPKFERNDTIQPSKIKYIRNTTKEERLYLEKIFHENQDETRFSAHKGAYELFYPYSVNGKKIVLFFSDYQRYGKLGS